MEGAAGVGGAGCVVAAVGQALVDLSRRVMRLEAVEEGSR